MNNSLDPIAFATSIAANIATTVIQSYASSFENSKFGSALKKAGIIKPDFNDNLKSAITRAVANLLCSQPPHLQAALAQALNSAPICGSLAKQIFEGETIDVSVFEQVIADCLDIPKNTPVHAWPYKIAPSLILRELAIELDRALAGQADPAIIWLGRRMAELVPAIAEIQGQLGELKEHIPSLFSNALIQNVSDDFTRFEKKYLHHLKMQYGRVVSPGVKELHGVQQSLSIAYISLNLTTHRHVEPQKAENVLIDNPLIVIRGPAGSGKTTLLNWITLCCTEVDRENNPWSGGVPFFIPLRRVARIEEGAPKASKFVDYSVDTQIWTEKTPDGWIAEILRQKRAIIMIDGVDELAAARRGQFWEWLDAFASEHEGNRIIVTSRTLPQPIVAKTPNDQWAPPPSFIDAPLQEMSTTDIRTFIAHWHDAVDHARLDAFDFAKLKQAKEELPAKLEDPSNRGIRDLCANPLLCAMVCVLNWREEGYLPRRRVDLYSACCDLLIEARDLKRDIKPSSGPLVYMTKNDKEMILQRLAFDMLHNKPDGDEIESEYRIEITREKAIDWIKHRISSFQQAEARSASPEDVLNYLLERSGLLREPASGLIDFPHRSFQEYLAACAAGAEGLEDFLAKQADDDQWHETIMLAAGTPTGGVGFGRALIQALLKRGERHQSSKPRSQRVKKTCFALALGCLENIKQQDETLRSSALLHVNDLVPPRNEDDARILSVAADAAVPFLQYNKWGKMEESVTAACARALRLIGSQSAEHTLLAGYAKDERIGVLREVCQSSVRFDQIPMVSAHVRSHGALPYYATVKDISQLEHVSGLKNYSNNGPLPKNISKLKLLDDITSIRFANASSTELSKIDFPPNISSLNLEEIADDEWKWFEKLPNLTSLTISGTLGTNLNHISNFTKLKSLSLRNMELSDIGFLENFHELKNLALRGMPRIESCSSISRLRALQELHLHQIPLASLEIIQGLPLIKLYLTELKFLHDFSPIAGMQALTELSLMQLKKGAQLDFPFPKSLQVVRIVSTDAPSIEGIEGCHNLEELMLADCKNLKDLNAIAAQPSLKRLQIMDCPEISSLQPLRGSRKLRNLIIAGCPHLKDIGCLSNFPNLEELSLDACADMSDLTNLTGLEALKNLRLTNAEIRDLNFVHEMPNLQEIVLYNCPKLEDITPLSNCTQLKRIVLASCSQIRDIGSLTVLQNISEVLLGNREKEKIKIPDQLKPYISSDNVFFHRWKRQYGPRSGVLLRETEGSITIISDDYRLMI